jgi:hypothetical protein
MNVMLVAGFASLVLINASAPVLAGPSLPDDSSTFRQQKVKTGDEVQVMFACLTADDALQIGTAIDRVNASKGKPDLERLQKAKVKLEADKIVNGDCWLLDHPLVGKIGDVVASEMSTDVRPVTLSEYPDKTFHIPMDRLGKDS